MYIEKSGVKNSFYIAFPYDKQTDNEYTAVMIVHYPKWNISQLTEPSVCRCAYFDFSFQDLILALMPKNLYILTNF